MPQNIVGPHGAGINDTTTRPTDSSSGSSVDSWFTPCVGGDPNTGTKIPAVWLNKVTALFRRAIRGMGVTENELDDDMLLKAIQRAARAIANIGTGVGLYKGYNAGSNTNEFYTIKAGSGVTLGLDTAAGELTISAGAGGISDGDKGDITVSGSGTTWTIDNLAVSTAKLADDAVTNAKLADATAQSLKGNPTSSSANPTDIVPSTLPTGTASANDYVIGHDAGGVLRRYQTSALGLPFFLGGNPPPVGSIFFGAHGGALAISYGSTITLGGLEQIIVENSAGNTVNATLTTGTYRCLGGYQDSTGIVGALWQRIA